MTHTLITKASVLTVKFVVGGEKFKFYAYINAKCSLITASG